jgi:Glycosyl transferase family 2
MSATFSTVVVVRNEEACDERTLATKIVPQAWIPHMEWARSRGIELATGDWILVVDADEVITAKLGERLRAQVATAGGAAAIWIPRLSCWFGHRLRHIGGYPDHQLRCFRRGAGLYPDRLHSHPEIDGRTLFMPAEEDAWILRSLPRMAAALTGHGLGRLWARRSSR